MENQWRSASHKCQTGAGERQSGGSIAVGSYQLFPDLGSEQGRLEGIFVGAEPFYGTLYAGRGSS